MFSDVLNFNFHPLCNTLQQKEIASLEGLCRVNQQLWQQTDSDSGNYHQDALISTSLGIRTRWCCLGWRAKSRKDRAKTSKLLYNLRTIWDIGSKKKNPTLATCLHPTELNIQRSSAGHWCEQYSGRSQGTVFSLGSPNSFLCFSINLFFIQAMQCYLAEWCKPVESWPRTTAT